MLNTFQVRDIILKHAQTFVAQNVHPLTYENQPDFKPPTSGTWSRLTIQYSSSMQAGLHGGRLERDFGIINIQCFARKGTGDYEVSELAVKWREHFRSLVVGKFEVTQTHAPTSLQDELGTDFVMILVRVDFRIN